jgi:hypothetical protein
MQCPAPHAYLRLKWGRLLFLVYLAVLALLAVFEFSNVIPQFHKVSAGRMVPCVLFLVALFYAFSGFLPLEPKPHATLD